MAVTLLVGHPSYHIASRRLACHCGAVIGGTRWQRTPGQIRALAKRRLIAKSCFLKWESSLLARKRFKRRMEASNG